MIWLVSKLIYILIKKEKTTSQLIMQQAYSQCDIKTLCHKYITCLKKRSKAAGIYYPPYEESQIMKEICRQPKTPYEPALKTDADLHSSARWALPQRQDTGKSTSVEDVEQAIICRKKVGVILR